MKVSQYGTFQVSSSAVAKTIKSLTELALMRIATGKEVNSAAENKFISVTSLRNCSQCFRVKVTDTSQQEVDQL